MPLILQLRTSSAVITLDPRGCSTQCHGIDDVHRRKPSELAAAPVLSPNTTKIQRRKLPIPELIRRPHLAPRLPIDEQPDPFAKWGEIQLLATIHV